ncbi:SDR family oxidoreductase [Paenibacillus wynnii]|uniref:SDR family oxidoreductase n=1 Tax=Paenibacillus wynnii TaxID=268407 RepID=UPI000A57CE70|nr:SDR family oxidoreductase [Paenibacillus wynnii]
MAKAGAFVYVTGRTTSAPSTNPWTGDIDSTIREIELEGGEGSAIRCDHTIDADTESVVQQIAEEQGKLDILVNNVWGGNELEIVNKPLWELPPAHWDNMFTSGVRAQLMTNYYANPLMRNNQNGVRFVNRAKRRWNSCNPFISRVDAHRARIEKSEYR